MGKGSQHQKVENRIVNLKTYHRLTVVGHEVFRSTNSLSALSMLGTKCDGTRYREREGQSEDICTVLPGSWIYPKSVDFWIRKMSMNIYGCLWMSICLWIF